MKITFKCIAILMILNFTFPMIVSAKAVSPVYHLIVTNLPDELCYLDLLIDKSVNDVRSNIQLSDKYDPVLYGILKDYNTDGWHAAMVTGTDHGLTGDIICRSTNGRADMEYTNASFFDRYKIIVVSESGTKITGVIGRPAYNGIIYFDYKTGRVMNGTSLPIPALLLLFAVVFLIITVEERILLRKFDLDSQMNVLRYHLIGGAAKSSLLVASFIIVYYQGFYAYTNWFLGYEFMIYALQSVFFIALLREPKLKKRFRFAITVMISGFILCGLILPPFTLLRQFMPIT